MTYDPAVFKKALDAFKEKVAEKALARAKEKGRPTDPWNAYEPEFIRGRLIQEIGEFLEKFLVFDNQEGRTPKDVQDENSELFDITALACSLWMANEGGGK